MRYACMQIQHTYTPDRQIIHVYFTVELCSVMLSCVLQTFFCCVNLCTKNNILQSGTTLRYFFFLWKPFFYISRFFGENMLNVVCLKGNVEFVCDTKIHLRPFYANISCPHPALYIYQGFLCQSSL